MEAALHFDAALAHQRLLSLCNEHRLDAKRVKNMEGLSNVNDQLNHLALIALETEYTSLVLATYLPLFPEVLARWISHSQYDSLKVFSAMGRVASLSVESLPLIEQFLAQNDNYEALFKPTADNERNKEMLLAIYRILFQDREQFVRYVEPSYLYPLLQVDHDAVRYLALQILGIYFEASESTREQWLHKRIDPNREVLGVYENVHNIDYSFLAVLEAKRISNGKSILQYYSNDGNSQLFELESCSDLLANVGGVLVPRLRPKGSTTDVNSEFVATETALANVRLIAHSLSQSKPILISGQSGSGKTFYIDEVAKLFSTHHDMVRIHLGDQTDAKILVGTYSTGEKPGSFEWCPGILTVAVKEGRWVMIEDIDKAPTEILSVLLPLLEKRELLIPSRGEVIKAKRGFQVFATMKSYTNKRGDEHTVDLIGKRLWHEIKVASPTVDELKLILKNRFPLLQNMSDTFVDTYVAVQKVFQDTKFISMSKSAQGRQISTRDLIKWAKRVEHMLRDRNITESTKTIPSNVYDDIFFEVVDCFASFIQTPEGREHLANVIGESLEVSSSRVKVFLKSHEPGYADNADKFHIGRAQLRKSVVSKQEMRKMAAQIQNFALTKHSLRLIEQVAVAVSMAEPLLLVGETGTGKTTVVQYLARKLHKNITVINVSQQTETGDLLGGYKPVDAKMIAQPMREEFELLFGRTFSSSSNDKFQAKLNEQFNKGKWSRVAHAWKNAVDLAKKHLSEEDENPKKKRKLDSRQRLGLRQQWESFEDKLETFEIQVKQAESSFFFTFVEGPLVQAVRNGDWVLLDEVNLASADTLESISDLLVENPSITLSEKGDAESVKAHPDFKLFACMNPATDVGKRDLPAGLRSRFTELYVQSPDQDITDLIDIIRKYIHNFVMNDQWICEDIAELYMEAKRLSEENKIVDGANQKPHFSIRTLTRTLVYATAIAPTYGLRRSLYEGFCMSFMTLLNQESEKLLEPKISQYMLGRLKNAKSAMSQMPKAPQDGGNWVQFKHYWLHQGRFEPELQEDYIITPFVEKNLLNLARATAGRRFPVLIQGPTSSGKTSMIKYLAKRTGHKFVRINNHEHTDLQEYLGSYISDERGQLKFQEGVLVEALRNGYWIVLDELNLAPTDVLEALNRLLDDNRELLIPETHEVVRPHPDFMLFATQNPPGLYGGRKVLSRAFRNRFLELHFDDIPQNELETILTQRCKIAPSYAKKIVDVYRQLSMQRQSTRLFEQKNSFATLRDLFRWAGREAVGYEQLALNGFMLLGERVRKKEERVIVKEVIEKVMRVKIDVDSEYKKLQIDDIINTNDTVVWTKGMRRLLVLVCQALQYNEPVLLVGETGCGKTTICQVLADATKKELHIVNAHQNTETGDIIGAQRPVRNRSELQQSLAEEIRKVLISVGHGFEQFEGADLDRLKEMYAGLDGSTLDPQAVERIQQLSDRLQILFEWSDGSLIQALKQGDLFLMDEISLADDSVLERLNSVLEPERALYLSEKGTQDANVVASNGFQFFATMNPGGDYGKKELSPALRNRFTEIWVPSMEDFDDVLQITRARLADPVKMFAKTIVNFGKWFGTEYGAGDASSGIISLRDILAWINFLNVLSEKIEPMDSVFHGACMVFIDSVGSNSSANLAQSEVILQQHRMKCIEKLSSLLGSNYSKSYTERYEVHVDDAKLEIGPFAIERYPTNDEKVAFNLKAPTTTMNALRVIRGMQAKKPILLEGSPGVGKTSLITAIANLAGRPLTRINLSEQTDLIDLFGSDAPAEGKAAGEFVWRDAPFLRAMQQGEWVLLDEMNLASQSVLEGLNACLDHRGETYIPELDKTFKCHPDFTVFAAQNPQYQGGGRKGLPKSFVNRFSVVYVDSLALDDLNLISQYLFPNIEPEVTGKLINFILELDYEVATKKSFGHLGSPFEFNLRDTMRWLGLIDQKTTLSAKCEPYEFFDLVIGSRFRTEKDRLSAIDLFAKYFGKIPPRDFYYQVGKQYLQVGHALTPRISDIDVDNSDIQPLQCNLPVLETAITCLNHSWPLILTGPTNSGKTSLIRFLADVLGANLHEFSMNGDIDSTDLLGGFDQVDLAHKSADIWREAEQLAIEVTAFALNHEQTQWLHALSIPTQILKHTIIRSGANVDELKNLLTACQSVPHFTPEFDTRFNKLGDQVTALLEEFAKVQTVRFQWFDGTLLKAVEEGHWLILDNANLCNPSVLDRLNSLLEPNGCLMVNECALENGEPRVVRPHKNFRLFLTVDPRYGELSRAMRNRGVEVFMSDLPSKATDFDQLVLRGPKKQSKEGFMDALDSLSLNEGSSLTFPVSAYVKPTNSMERFFAQLDDAVSLAGTEVQGYLTTAQLNVLPVEALRLVKRWSQVVCQSGQFNEDSQFVVEHLVQQVEDLNREGCKYLVPLQELYETASSAVELPLGLQPLNPHVNRYFSRFAQYAGYRLGSKQMSLLLRCLLSVHSLHRRLEVANSALNSKKESEMSYFVKSVALATGKTMRNPVRVSVYSVVYAIKLLVEKVLNGMFTCEFNLEMNQLLAVKDLQQIGTDLTILTDSSSVDESQLHVYREILDSWLLKHGHALDFDNLLDSVKQQVSLFGSKLELATGTSMVKIWSAFKGQYPTTEQGWNRFNRISMIASRFDQVSEKLFSDSIETVCGLRSALIDMLLHVDVLDSSEIDGTIDNIENGINKLDELTETFQDERSHPFKDTFALLKAYLEISTMKKNGSDVFDTLVSLAYYSNSPTRDLVAFRREQLNNPRLPFFESLWDSATGSRVSSAIDDSIVGRMLKSRASCQNVKSTAFHQTKSDLKSLGKTLVENMSIVLSDRLRSFADILKMQVRQVMELHSDGVGFDLDMFKSIESKYFQPALSLLEESVTSTAIGKAWVQFSLGMILLYVPNIPFDPAIREHVEHNRYMTNVRHHETEVSAWNLVKNVFYGPMPDAVTSEMKEHDGSMTIISKPATYRPAVSEAASLHQEWMALVQSSVGEAAVERLIGGGSADQIAVWQSNTLHFIERMKKKYQGYADITDIFDGFVYGLKLGFDLVTIETDNSVTTPYWLIDPVILATPRLSDVVNSVVNGNPDTPLDVSSEVLIQVLNSVAVQSRVSGKPAPHDLVSRILSDFHLKWQLRRQKEKQEAEAKEAMYIDDTEQAIEEEFAEMFPDYEGDSSDIFTKKDEERESNYQLAVAYMKLYGFGSDSLESTTQSAVDVVSSCIEHDSNKMGHYHGRKGRVLPSVLASVAKSAKGTQDESGNSFNFYHESNRAETDRVVSLTFKIKQAVHSLLQRWPEHQTLQELHLACVELLQYPISTPVARFLQKVDQIYTFLNQWEENASREVSLRQVIHDVTKLIVDWRGLELRTWSKLFEFEQNSAEKDIGKWWFHLYESVIIKLWNDLKEGNALDTAELVQVLTIFVAESTIGQFKARLDLLRSFAANVDEIVTEYPHVFVVSASIRNVIQFYNQYAGDIESKLQKETKELQQKVHEKIKLVTFKDTNPAALKQSTKKSHHDLHKIVRKYRELMNQKVTSIVDGPPSLSTKSQTGSVSLGNLPSFPSVDAHIKAASTIKECKSRPSVLSNPGTISKLGSHAVALQEVELPSLNEYVTDILAEMERLRKETPSVLNDDNKKLVSQLRSQKSKLLSDTLNGLRRGGLNTTVKANVVNAQARISTMLANTPALGVREQYCGQADGYFFKLLEMLPRLRSNVISSEADIPRADLSRGLAIAENLMNKLMVLRAEVGDYFDSYDIINKRKESMNKMASLFEADIIVGRADGADKWLQVVQWIPEVMNFAVNTCQSIASLAGVNAAVGVFVECSSRAKDLRREFETYNALHDADINTEKYQSLQNSVASELMSLKEAIAGWKTKNPELALVGDLVIEWITESEVQPFAVSRPKVEPSAADSNVMSLEVELQKLCKSILVISQDLAKLMYQPIVQDEDTKWISESLKRAEKMHRLLRQSVIGDCLKNVLSIAASVGGSGKANSSKVISMVGSCLPFVHGYAQLCNSVGSLLMKSYTDTAKTASSLFSILQQLATNGFCTPQEPQDQKQEDSGKTESGTGLGDGSGAQDHSQDIEDDEDLTEHAQKDNEDQSKEEERDDENDNAVDIEGDMAGELEDAPDQGEDDKDEDQDENEDEEPDEEIGDINDLDPNAVDEKMWNDDSEQKKDEKEKQSDAVPENSNNDDDMQGNDDEDNDESNDAGSGQEDGDNDQAEDDENAEDEEDVGEQDDAVQQQKDSEELEQQAEETEKMELPEDMNLDGDENDQDEEKNGEEEEEEMADFDEGDMPDQEEHKPGETEPENVEEDEGDDREGDEDEESNDKMDVDDELDDENNNENHEPEGDEQDNDNNDEIKDKNSGEDAEDQMNIDAQGLHGPDDADDEVDSEQATSGKQESANKSEGADQTVAEEQENVDDGQGSGAKPEDQQNQDEEDEQVEAQDQARKEAEESMKQLGDALKEFHKRRQEIKEAGERDDMVEDTANERPDEFEHLEGAESKNDTQALGSATQDQVQKIDDSMAIDDDEQDDKPQQLDQEQTTHEQPPLEQPVEEAGDSGDMPTQGPSTVGERNNEDPQESQVGGDGGDMDISDDESEVEDAPQQVDDDGNVMEPSRSMDEARDMWRKYEVATQDLALALCEQLRLILEPTQATKLRGDFKTGKRLNMKRIIPYIASQFKKDKIWMRRTKPSKRQYQIMISVDDSKSMSESKSVDLAFQTIALVSKALTQLEAGQLSITRFGEQTHMVHPFQKPFSGESGAEVLQWFGFDQERTNVKRLLDKSIKLFDEARAESRQDLWQLEIIISDGICEDHERLRQLVRRAQDERIMLVFVVVDAVNKQGSILELNQVNYVTDDNGNSKMVMQKYLDKFPFDYYVIVNDIQELPGVLSLVLRQYFAEVSEV